MSEMVMRDNREHIVDLLLKCPSIKDREQRDVVVSLLRPEMKQAIRRSDGDRIDVINIVLTCLNYPQGIEELSQYIHFVEGNTTSWQDLDNFLLNLFPSIISPIFFERLWQIISEIHLSEGDLQCLYRESAPSEWSPPSGIDTRKTIYLMAKQLARAMQQTDGTIPLITFIEHLQLVVSEKKICKKLKNWNDTLAKDIGVMSQLNVWRESYLHKSLRKKANKTPLSQYYLLVKLQPDTLDRELFWVDAWLVSDGESDIMHLHTEDVPRALDTLSPLLNNLLSMSIRQIKDRRCNIIVEFFLPLQFLCFDIDQWKINIGLNKEVPLGHCYPVVLRSLDRAYSHHEYGHEQLMRAWQIHWCKLEQKLTRVKVVYCHMGEYESRRNWQAFLEDAMYVALTFFPPANYEQIHVSLLKEIIIAGNSVVLWPRKEIDYLNEEEIKKIYQSLLARCSFARVPELLWQKRKEALRNDNEQHIVHYLTLLWDDPNRLPPDANADQFSAPLKKGIEM